MSRVSRRGARRVPTARAPRDARAQEAADGNAAFGLCLVTAPAPRQRNSFSTSNATASVACGAVVPSRALAKRCRAALGAEIDARKCDSRPNLKKVEKNDGLGWFLLATPTCWGSISPAVDRTRYSDLPRRCQGAHRTRIGGSSVCSRAVFPRLRSFRRPAAGSEGLRRWSGFSFWAFFGARRVRRPAGHGGAGLRSPSD